MLVCFWMMMTFHHRASAEVFFCMTRLKALQLKYLSSKTEELLKRLFFSVLAHDLSVSCSVSSDVRYDHDLLVPFIPSDAHDQCLFFRFLHLCWPLVFFTACGRPPMLPAAIFSVICSVYSIYCYTSQARVKAKQRREWLIMCSHNTVGHKPTKWLHLLYNVPEA